MAVNDLLKTSRKAVDPVVRLRSLIRRKTTEKQRLQKDMEQLDLSMGPLREAAQEHVEVDREVHERFQQAMAKPGLSKANRARVRGLYEELQRDGVLAPPPSEPVTEDNCPCPACTAARAAQGERKEAGQPGWNDAEAGAEGFDGAPAGRSPFEGGPAGGMPADHAAAAKPERDKGLRALYHTLARQYHPDRAEDEAERAARGAVMREVNDAYHSGDTQRLLELSRELGVDVEGLVGGAGLLHELVQQYELLKADLRALRASFLGTLVVDTRRAVRDRTEPPLDMLLECEVAMRDELRRIRDFVGDFVEGRISLKTLMAGPPREDAEDLGDLGSLAGLGNLGGLGGVAGLGSLADFEGLEDVGPGDIDLLREVLRRGPQVSGLGEILDAIGEALRGTEAPKSSGARPSAKRKKQRPPQRR